MCSSGHLLKLAVPLKACLLAGCLPHKTVSSTQEGKCCGVHSCGSRSTRKYRGNTVQRMKTGLLPQLPGCAFAPDGVTRGQFLSLSNNIGSNIPGLASSLKHTPHQAACPSGGPRRPPTPGSALPLGSTSSGLPRPHPAPGITPVREELLLRQPREKEAPAETRGRGAPLSEGLPLFS